MIYLMYILVIEIFNFALVLIETFILGGVLTEARNAKLVGQISRV